MNEQKEFQPRTFVGKRTYASREAKLMACQSCREDVWVPCHDTQEMRQRAMSHVERWEKALNDDLSDGINSSDGQSAGSIRA